MEPREIMELVKANGLDRALTLIRQLQGAQKVPKVRAYRSGAVNHTSSGNWQKVPLETASYDVHGGDSGHFDAANNRLICRVAGLYAVVGAAGFVANGTGGRGAWIYRNGVAYSHGTFLPVVGAGFGPGLPVGDHVQLAVGDYVELWAFQSSGANLAYLTGSDFNRLAMVRVSA